LTHTRRQFLRTGAPFAAAAIFAPEALASGITGRSSAALRGGRFSDGVISGEPTTSGISLWSRVDGVERAGSVTVEVARDKAFKNVVARKSVATSAKTNHAVKATVQGLKAHEEYFYRFHTATEDSPVGRFRTALPADSNEPVRFAFFSCADYTHGWYNAYERMAAEDVDFVVCLGDYIYDETYHSKAGGTGVRDDRIGRQPKSSYKDVLRAAHTLQDYRDKYSLYRSDASLRKMHAEFPMVVLWDDHEVQNNYAGKPANGGLPADEEYTRKRRAAGYKAFFESMPVSPKGSSRIYRSTRFGKNVELFVMDQRQYRDDQPCNDAVAPACADWDQPRDFLGRTQMDWIKSGLKASQANWKIMANELMVMPAKVLGDSYFTFDNWQGYPREREELLGHIKDNAIKDVVFITGDIHTFIVGDVRTQMGSGESVALEFVGGSITSQGLGETNLDAGGGATIKGNDKNPSTPPALIDALRSINPWVDAADFDHHGYGVVEARSDGLDCNFVRLQTIKKKSTAILPGDSFAYKVARGQTSVKGQHGPPAA
jgi:alkaline phosphatase D